MFQVTVRRAGRRMASWWAAKAHRENRPAPAGLDRQQSAPASDRGRPHLAGEYPGELVLDLDPAMSILQVSLGDNVTLGRSHDTLIHASFLDLVDARDVADFEGWMVEAMASEADEFGPREFRVRNPIAEPQWVSMRGIRKSAADGPAGVLLGLREIDEHEQSHLVAKAHEKALAEASERLAVETERLQRVLSATRLGLWEWDIRTGETAFDDRWGEIIGYSPTELTAGNVEQLAQCHPDDQHACRDGIQAILDGLADTYDIEVRMQHKDGRWIWVRDRGHVVERTPDGQPARMAGTHEDITELAMARESLKAERGRLRATIDGQMDPAMLLDPILNESEKITDFTVDEANARAAEALGVDFPALIGAPLSTVVHWRAFEFWLTALTDIVESGDSLALDDLPDPGGSGSFLDVRASRVGLGVSVTWRDVTERHTAAAKIADAEQHFRLLAENSHDVVFLLAANGEMSWVSPSANVTLGYHPDELIGPASRNLVHHEDVDTWVRTLREVQDTGRIMRFRVRMRNATGTFRWMAVTIGRAIDSSGTYAGLTGSLQDIQEQVLAEQALAASEEMFRVLSENSPDVVLRIHAGVVEWASPALTRMLGWHPQDWIGHSLADFIPVAEVPWFEADLAKVAEDGSSLGRFQVRDSSGSCHWIETHSQSLHDARGRVDGVVTSFRTIDREVAKEEDLRRRAELDPLTGLLNRAEVLRRLDRIASRPERPSDRWALLFCDLDNFKTVNDSLGHSAGDDLLRAVADRIRSCGLRADDLVARIGGDEILVVLTSVPDLATATDIADQIRRRVAEPLLVTGQPLTTTISVGSALAEPGEDVDTVIQRADHAMYEAKRFGRNRVVAGDDPGMISR